MNTERIMISLDTTTLNDLQDVATKNSMTKSSIIKLLINSFLSKELETEKH